MIIITESFLFWTALSFIVLLIFTCLALITRKEKKRNYKYMAIIFMLGIYLSNVTFMSSLIFFGNAVEWKGETATHDDLSIKNFTKNTPLPVKSSVFNHYNTEFKIQDSDILLRDSIFYGLIYSTKMGGLGVKYQALIPTSFYFGKLSGLFFVILTILTPIAFGGLVASFFEGAISILRYYLTKNFCDIYYFSELNEKTILLAKNIYKHSKTSLIVFCNKTKNISSNLLQEIKTNGFISFTRNELDFVKYSNRKHYFFEMKNDEIQNITDATALLSEFQKIANKISEKRRNNLLVNNKVYLVAEKETSFEVINNLPKFVRVIILNRYRTPFYNVLLNKPLYNCLKNGRTDFSILVVGAGKCGTEIIKACIWCTQLGTEYSTKINVIDKNATNLKKRLKKECPELISDLYNINFYDCDVNTSDFYELLSKYCYDANYITVATGTDDNNLNIALDLRRFYIKNSLNYDKTPLINVFIGSNEYLNSVQGIINNKTNNLDTFGSDEEFYNYSLVVNSDVEKLAINSSRVYEEELNDKSQVYSKYYNRPEIEIDSNRTNAIHLIYKLFILGYGIIKRKDATTEQINNSKILLKELEEIVSGEIKKEEYEDINRKRTQLAKIEKERWNAFYRSEGWCGVSKDNFYYFKRKYNSHKNLNLKQHACICPYEMLKYVDEFFNKDFHKYDFVFLRDLTKTLGLKDKEEKINITNVDYILIQLDRNN